MREWRVADLQSVCRILIRQIYHGCRLEQTIALANDAIWPERAHRNIGRTSVSPARRHYPAQGPGRLMPTAAQTVAWARRPRTRHQKMTDFEMGNHCEQRYRRACTGNPVSQCEPPRESEPVKRVRHGPSTSARGAAL